MKEMRNSKNSFDNEEENREETKQKGDNNDTTTANNNHNNNDLMPSDEIIKPTPTSRIYEDELPENFVRPRCPEEKANVFSYLTYWWMNNLISVGNKKVLEEKHLSMLD